MALSELRRKDSNEDDDEDLEALRLAALTALQKKSQQRTLPPRLSTPQRNTNRLANRTRFQHRNLIVIQTLPTATADQTGDEIPENGGENDVKQTTRLNSVTMRGGGDAPPAATSLNHSEEKPTRFARCEEDSSSSDDDDDEEVSQEESKSEDSPEEKAEDPFDDLNDETVFDIPLDVQDEDDEWLNADEEAQLERLNGEEVENDAQIAKSATRSSRERSLSRQFSEADNSTTDKTRKRRKHRDVSKERSDSRRSKNGTDEKTSSSRRSERKSLERQDSATTRKSPRFSSSHAGTSRKSIKDRIGKRRVSVSRSRSRDRHVERRAQREEERRRKEERESSNKVQKKSEKKKDSRKVRSRSRSRSPSIQIRRRSLSKSKSPSPVLPKKSLLSSVVRTMQSDVSSKPSILSRLALKGSDPPLTGSARLPVHMRLGPPPLMQDNFRTQDGEKSRRKKRRS